MTIKLYTNVPATVKHRRVLERVSIGSLSVRVVAKGSQALTLSLDPEGRKLLREKHKLTAQLSIGVKDQEGATLSISRTLVLTNKR